MTTLTEPTRRPWPCPGAVLTYDVRRADSDTTAPVAAHDRLADGRRRLRHAGRPLPRPHGHHLRPAGRRAEHQGRPDQPVDARAARRRCPPDHRRARLRSGRPVREQRRRGERARPRGRAPGGCPRRWSRTSRRSPAMLPDREGALAACRAVHETYQAQRLRRGHGALHPRREPPGADRRRSSPASRRRIPRCSGCRPRTTARAPMRCSARTSSPAPRTSRTSTRCVRRRPDRHRGRCRSPKGQLATAARARRPSGSAGARDLPERPRRLPGRRVRPDGRTRRVRGQAPRGARRGPDAATPPPTPSAPEEIDLLRRIRLTTRWRRPTRRAFQVAAGGDVGQVPDGPGRRERECCDIK